MQSFYKTKEIYDNYVAILTSSKVFKHKVCYQYLFNSIKCAKDSRYFNPLKTFFFIQIHILLCLISILTLIRFILKKNTIAHYIIDSQNNNGYYDRRSIYILKLLSPNKTINFLHSGNLLYSLSNFHKKQNPFYFESFIYLILIFKTFFINKENGFYGDNILNKYKKLYDISKLKISCIRIILKILGVKKFIAVDDSRHLGELSIACKYLNIPLHLYMHARFNHYHVGLSSLIFYKYYVWSDYFKDILMKLNTDANCKSIEVIGHPTLKNNINKLKKITCNILVIGESNIDYDLIKIFFDKLDSIDKYKIYFKDKPGSKNIEYISTNFPKWKLINTKSLEKTFFENNINLVVGTHSTVLIESWLFGIPSLMIKSNYDYSWHLVDENIIPGCSEPYKLDICIDYCLNMTSEKILNIKNIFWETSNRLPKIKLRNYISN